MRGLRFSRQFKLPGATPPASTTPTPTTTPTTAPTTAPTTTPTTTPTTAPAGTVNRKLLEVTGTYNGTPTAPALVLRTTRGGALHTLTLTLDDGPAAMSAFAQAVNALDTDDGCGGREVLGATFAMNALFTDKGTTGIEGNGIDTAYAPWPVVKNVGAHPKNCLSDHSDAHSRAPTLLLADKDVDAGLSGATFQLNSGRARTMDKINYWMNTAVTPAGLDFFPLAANNLGLEWIESGTWGFTHPYADGLDNDFFEGNLQYQINGGSMARILSRGSIIATSARENLDNQLEVGLAVRPVVGGYEYKSFQNFLDEMLAFQASRATTPERFYKTFFTHKPFQNGTDPTTVLNRLSAGLNYVRNHASVAANGLWVPSAQGLIEWVRLVQKAVVSAPRIAGNVVTWTIDLSALPDTFRWHNFTPELSGGPVTGIRVSGAESVSYVAGSNKCNVYKRAGYGGVAASSGTSTSSTTGTGSTTGPTTGTSTTTSTSTTTGSPGSSTTPTTKTSGYLPIDLDWVYLNNTPTIDLTDLFTADLAAVPGFRSLLKSQSTMRIICPPGLAFELDAIELYDGPGRALDGGTTPMGVYYVAQGTTVQTLLGNFDGSNYTSWTAPYAPAAPGLLVQEIGLLLYNQAPLWPLKFRARGRYVPQAAVVLAPEALAAEDGVGVNNYPYDYHDRQAYNAATGDSGVHVGVIAAKADLVAKVATMARHYWNINDLRSPIDQQPYAQIDVDRGQATAAQMGQFRTPKGTYRAQPRLRGGYYVDDILAANQARGVENLLCLLNSPLEVARTWYPAGTPDSGVDDDTVPYRQGDDPLNSASYALSREAARQLAIRYGHTVHPLADSLFATVEQTYYDPQGRSQKKTGLGTVTYFEIGNEMMKYWKGLKSYFEAAPMAVYLVEMKAGLLEGDPGAKLVMSGMFEADAGYVEAVYRQWARMGVACPVDVWNVHEYSQDATHGVPTGFTKLRSKFQGVKRVIQRHHPNTATRPPLWRTEAGYGVSSNGTTSVKATANTTLAQWQAIRNFTDMLNDLAVGISHRLTYQLNHDGSYLGNPATTSTASDISCGIADSQGVTLYASGYYFQQWKTLATGYVTAPVVQNPEQMKDVVSVHRYTKAGAPELLVLWYEDEVERTGTYPVNLPYGGTRYQFSPSSAVPVQTVLPAGNALLAVSHDPCVVLINLAPTPAPTSQPAPAPTSPPASQPAPASAPQPQPAPQPAPTGPGPATTTYVTPSAMNGIPNGINWQPPFMATVGGTYDQNYRSLDSNVPAFQTNCGNQPVIITSPYLASAGELVSGGGGCNITMRGVRGFPLPQTLDGKAPGRFVAAYMCSNLLVEQCELNGTSGIYVDHWGGGDGSNGLTIKVRRNRSRNVDGRYRNGGTDYRQFFQATNTHIAGWVVEQNEIVNFPDQSRVEDNINFYNAGGTAASPFLIQNNCIQGAYPFPATDTQFTGTGMTWDGDTNDPALTCLFVKAYRNIVISTCNAGINVATGHDGLVEENDIITSGLLDDGRQLRACYAGTSIFNSGDRPATAFFNNSSRNNTLGYMRTKDVIQRNDQDDGPGNTMPAGGVGNYHLPAGPITLADEHAKWVKWLNYVSTNNLKIGPLT